MKLCTHARSGGNLHLIWVSEVGVAKWLNRATYNISTKCPSSYVLHTCNIPIPTKKEVRNPTFRIFSASFVPFLPFSGVVFSKSSSWRFKQIIIKFGQCNLKLFVMLNCEDLEFSLKSLSVAA